jgi:hypothetical protein
MKMNNLNDGLPLISLISLCLCAIGQPVLGQSPSLVVLAESHFDDRDILADGWQGTNNATLNWVPGGPTLASTGYISVSQDAGDGLEMYFVAPSKFLGDKHTAYNGYLTFYLKQSATSSLYKPDPFVLLSSSNLVLSYYLHTVPGTQWQAVAVPLNENVGWFNSTSNQLATKEDFQVVLKATSRLWIAGEYSNHNSDETDLDDVQLLAQPSGPPQPTLALASYAGISISGEVGASYRIEFRRSLDATNDWQQLAELVLPASPYLFFDTNSISAPGRFYRAVSEP